MQEEEGQTLVEYGLLISLLALVVIAVLTVLGRRLDNVFNAADQGLNGSGSLVVDAEKRRASQRARRFYLSRTSSTRY